MLTATRSTCTADALARWFQSFQSEIRIDPEQLLCLTSNGNLEEIWKEIIRHCHPKDFVKKVKENLRIHELKERHPDRWEQHRNAQIQQNQLEQRITIRLREISSTRSDQSTNLFNEFNRLESILDEEKRQISSFDKQFQIYRQIQNHLQQLSKFKEQIRLLTTQQTNSNINLLNELINSKCLTKEKVDQPINLNDLCSMINQSIQQRINQLNRFEKDVDERSTNISEIYEEALNKVNLDFTKQFLHLSNIRQECGKIRDRLEESKRDVLARRSSNEQNQLLNILDAMISSKSIDVHLSLLKKKVQNESEQTKKNEEKLLPKLHQQINEKRNELNRIDQQLNHLIQENPLEIFEKLEIKIRDFIRLLSELPSKIHSLNLTHLSISNELRSNILNWSNEQISRIDFIPIESTDKEIQFETTQNSSRSNSLIPNRSERPSSTPLTSLKQLLGIRTQDTTQIEPIVNHQEIFNKEENQRWQSEFTDDETLTMKFPSISSINWDLLTRVDQQIDETLKQCQTDFHQYEFIFENLLKDIRIYQSESKHSFLLLQ